MALVIVLGGAIVLGVKGVRSGIKAHKDHKRLSQDATSTISESNSGSEGVHTIMPPPLKRINHYGEPVTPGPLYNLVWRAEERLKKGKGKGKKSSKRSVQSGAEVQRSQDDPSPSYTLDAKPPVIAGGETHGPPIYTSNPERANGDTAPPSYIETLSSTTVNQKSGRGGITSNARLLRTKFRANRVQLSV